MSHEAQGILESSAETGLQEQDWDGLTRVVFLNVGGAGYKTL